MAGGGSLMKPERSKRGKFSKRKKLKRVGFHVDMTPLVDITFLLLTFFMFTTTYASPQVMQMSVPPEEKEEVEVRQSDLFQIFVRDDNVIFYALGQDDPQAVSLEEVKGLVERENFKDINRANKIITALKVSQGASYGLVVNILDELNLAESNISMEVQRNTNPETGELMNRERRFTIVPILESELEKIKDIQINDK